MKKGNITVSSPMMGLKDWTRLQSLS